MKPTSKKPGPKPITYIPVPFREIEGIEQVTTFRQLKKLEDYLETPSSERPPCVRLGASVPIYYDGVTRKPTVTYDVMVDGEVSVVKMQSDPRAAHKWFLNPRRPWQLSARFSASTGGA